MFEVTLPRPVADRLVGFYKEGGLILEYGTGGSTFLALNSNPNNVVYGCETDPVWLSRLTAEIGRQRMNDRFIPVYQDIGKTKGFGNPCFETQVYDEGRGRQFAVAPIIPWKLFADHHVSPDYILIDGRFRVSSFVISFFNAKKPCKVIFDDYVDRPKYHVVENFIKPSEFVDRAAIFDFVPVENAAVNAKMFLDFYANHMTSFG